MTDPSSSLGARAGAPQCGSQRIEDALRIILKRYDRIGFGRRGVLDAEADIRHLASSLSSVEHACLRKTVMSWIAPDVAEGTVAPLLYNLPEHLQALAIRLCTTIPIPESLSVICTLQASLPNTSRCETALREALVQFAIARLEVPPGDELSGIASDRLLPDLGW